MKSNFVSMTNLQRSAKKVFSSSKSYQLVLNNNELAWILLWKEMSEAMLDSWFLDQIREEMYEANDDETVKIIDNHRLRKGIAQSYDDVMKEYESI